MRCMSFYSLNNTSSNDHLVSCTANKHKNTQTQTYTIANDHKRRPVEYKILLYTRHIALYIDAHSVRSRHGNGIIKHLFDD